MEPEIMGYSHSSSAFNTLNASDDSTLNAPVESVAVNGLNRRASVEADNVESLQQTLDEPKTNDKNVFKRFKELWLIKKIMAFFQCIFCCSASGKKPENAASAPLPDSNGPTISIVVHECSDPVEPPLVVVSDVPQSVETSHVVGEEVLQDSDDREQLVESEVRTDPGADPSVTAVRDTELQSSALGNAETVEMSQDREQLNEMAHMGGGFDGMEDFSNDGQPVSLQRAHGQQPEFLSLSSSSSSLSTISERTEPLSLASSTQKGGTELTEVVEEVRTEPAPQEDPHVAVERTRSLEEFERLEAVLSGGRGDDAESASASRFTKIWVESGGQGAILNALRQAGSERNLALGRGSRRAARARSVSQASSELSTNMPQRLRDLREENINRRRDLEEWNNTRSSRLAFGSAGDVRR